MKKKKILVYDIFIYTTLILAISILALGGVSYFYSLQEKSNLKNELNGAIKELKGETDRYIKHYNTCVKFKFRISPMKLLQFYVVWQRGFPLCHRMK